MVEQKRIAPRTIDGRLLLAHCSYLNLAEMSGWVRENWRTRSYPTRYRLRLKDTKIPRYRLGERGTVYPQLPHNLKVLRTKLERPQLANYH
jgi:hypothetical protein